LVIRGKQEGENGKDLLRRPRTGAQMDSRKDSWRRDGPKRTKRKGISAEIFFTGAWKEGTWL